MSATATAAVPLWHLFLLPLLLLALLVASLGALILGWNIDFNLLGAGGKNMNVPPLLPSGVAGITAIARRSGAVESSTRPG
jgi:hypothetical protein